MTFQTDGIDQLLFNDQKGLRSGKKKVSLLSSTKEKGETMVVDSLHSFINEAFRRNVLVGRCFVFIVVIMITGRRQADVEWTKK